MTTYHATLTREGPKYWVIEIPELGGVTQARNLREAEDMAQDYIAAVTGVPAERVEFRFPGLDEAVAGIEAERSLARSHEAKAQESARLLARRLREMGVSLKDIGRVLGVSHQRAHQVIAGDA
ncbi:MAG: hypothetical protein LBL01_03485 [Bifidobacteriaceae bacterium]|jgi:predicted RNase H-like HicB family nuclease|nr:hypothetical protein [Bifidobacteriaceae bacterium]